MQKLWAGLFGVVLLGCFLLTVVALVPPLNEKWGLPTNIAAVYGARVDDLFYLILAFVAFFFVLTEALLVYALFKYVHTDTPRRATYTHGNHTLELAWTIVPAAILIYIAYAQISTWEDIKYLSHFPDPDQVIQVTARQWEWRLRYRAEEDESSHVLHTNWDYLPKEERGVRERAWGETAEFDDIHLPNALYTWKDAKVKILLKTNDIIHSFFLPNLRLKQDALPGKTIPMWFEVNDWNAKFDATTGKTTVPDSKKQWEIACAELCGGGHYRMRGRLFVFETKPEYDAWLKYTKAQETSRQPETANPSSE